MGKKGKAGGAKKAQPRVLPGSLVLGVETARDLLDLLNDAGLSGQNRLAILNADGKGKPVANNRDPLFFDDLIPSNFRREGIWQRSLNAIVEAEPTSATARRDVYDTPAGLTNLGNTCYANSALQVLYTNKVFRAAIYDVEEEVVEGDATGMLSELRKLFLDMQFCDNAIADPRAFANMLKLQASEQQDAQEFQKLLMQRLEERLQRSAKPPIKRVLANLYSGQSSYVTTCRKCRQESRMSSEVSEYFELDLQVKGVKTLAKSLQALVAADALEGNNQYSCENCGCKQDADRQFCVRTLPPCLRINLQRFVFDWQSLQKQKCKDAISFPMDIDLTSFVHPVPGGAQTSDAQAQPPLQYTLTAIILHRGSSASSGHYVSIVKDERLGVWWKYDDDSVTNMGVHPFKGAKWDPVSGDGDANGASGPKKGAAKKKTTGKATKAAPKTPTTGPGPKGKAGKGGTGTRGGKKSEVIQIEETGPPAAALEVQVMPAAGAAARESTATPPATACRKRSLADVSANTPAALAELLAGNDGVAAKRVCSTQPASGAAGSSPGDVQICSPTPGATEPGTKRAVSGDGDPAADAKTGPLPQDLSSKDAYMLIYTQAGYNCGSCVPERGCETSLPLATRAILESIQDARAKEDAEEAAQQSSLKAAVEKRREHIKAVVNFIKPDLENPEDAYFIDAEWLTKWANAPPSEEMPAMNNMELTCDHGGLDPLSWDSAKRISRTAWQMLKQQWDGGPELTQKELCVECTKAQLEEIVQKQDIDVQRKGIVEQVKRCLDAPADEAEFMEGMMLVSRKWLTNWKTRSCKLSYLNECMSPTASITCRHDKLLPAKSGKGTNRVAITEEVFRFISTHWRPVPPPKPGAGAKSGTAGDSSNAAKDTADADDVEMVDAVSPHEHACGACTDAPAAGVGTADASEEQENTARNEREDEGDDGMDVDAESDDVKDAADGDGKEGSGKEGLMQIDDDDDVVIATPSGEGAAGGSTGQEDNQLREFQAMHADELECPECSVLMTDTAEKEANLRKRVMEERNALKTLSSTQMLHLENGIEYMLVPQIWLSSWRSWVTGTPWKAGGGATAVGRGTEVKAKAADTLKKLDDVMAEFCIKNVDSGEVKLLHELPVISQHRGRWAQADSDSEVAMTVIEADQWELLKQYHGSDETPDLPVHFLLKDAPPDAACTAAAPQTQSPAQLQAELQVDSSPVEIGDSPSTCPLAQTQTQEQGDSTVPKIFMQPLQHGAAASTAACRSNGAATEPIAAAVPSDGGAACALANAVHAVHSPQPAERRQVVEVTMSPGGRTPGQQSPGCLSPGEPADPAVSLASSAAQFVSRTSPAKRHMPPASGIEPVLGPQPTGHTPPRANAATPAVPSVPVVPAIPAQDGCAAADVAPETATLATAAQPAAQTSFQGFQMLPRGAGEQLQTPHLRQWEREAAVAAERATGGAGVAITTGGSAVATNASTEGLSAQPSDLSIIQAYPPSPGSDPTTINISPGSTILGESSFAQLAPTEPLASPLPTREAAVRAAAAAAGPQQATGVFLSDNVTVSILENKLAGTPNTQNGAAPAPETAPMRHTHSESLNQCTQPLQQSDADAARPNAACGNMHGRSSVPGNQEPSSHTLLENSLKKNSLSPQPQSTRPQPLPTQQRKARTASLNGEVLNIHANKGKKHGAVAVTTPATQKAGASKAVGKAGGKKRGGQVSQDGKDSMLVDTTPATRTRSRRWKGGSGSASDGDSQGAAEIFGAQGDAADAAGATAAAGGNTAAAVQKIGLLQPSFTVCRDTIRQREMERKSALLVFDDMPLLCQLVTYEQAVTDNVPVASSKRSRRGRVIITACHSSTLRTLKMRLYSDLDVHPMNMDCYVKGRLLENDDLNLQQLEVAYTDVVNIVKVDRVPNDDYALLIEWQNMTGLNTDVVVAAKTSGAPIKERGFVDTLLAGGP